MTADVEALQDLVGQGLAVFLVSITLIVGTIVAMLLMSWQLALITLALMPILLWSPPSGSGGRRAARTCACATASAARSPRLQEGLAGVRVIQAFDQTDRTVGDFTRTSREQYLTSVGAERIAAIYVAIVELVQGVAFALIIGLGAYFASEGDVSVGVVTAFVLYLNNLFEPIQQLTQVFNSFQQAAAALHKLYGLLDEPPISSSPQQPVELPVAGDLVVDSVSFRYTPQLRPGAARRVAHARAREAARARRPHRRGQVDARQADGAVLRPDRGRGRASAASTCATSTRPTLRRRIVVIPQEGFLFTGTIRENLLMAAPDADDARIRAALDDLGLDRAVRQLPRRPRHAGRHARDELLGG